MRIPALITALLLPAIAFAKPIGNNVQQKAAAEKPAAGHFEKGGRLLNEKGAPAALAVGRKLADELDDVDGIMIHVAADDVSVDGEVFNEIDYDKVRKAVDRMNELTPQSANEVVILNGKSAHLTIPFAFTEGMNSNPSVVQTHVDLPHREVTFFARAEGLATFTVVDPKNRKHVVEYDIRVVPAR